MYSYIFESADGDCTFGPCRGNLKFDHSSALADVERYYINLFFQDKAESSQAKDVFLEKKKWILRIADSDVNDSGVIEVLNCNVNKIIASVTLHMTLTLLPHQKVNWLEGF